MPWTTRPSAVAAAAAEATTDDGRSIPPTPATPATPFTSLDVRPDRHG